MENREDRETSTTNKENREFKKRNFHPRKPRVEGNEEKRGERSPYRGNRDRSERSPKDGERTEKSGEKRFNKRNEKKNFNRLERDNNKQPNLAIDGVRQITDMEEKSNLNFRRDLKSGVEANIQIAKDSLANKNDENNKSKVRITPLGGLGEIGGNITVIETENCAIVVDVGMSFPDDGAFGADILVPDFSYLHAIKHKIAGVIITHAHEDHIGAMPFLYKELQFPIYGTPLPLGMIGNKFDEHGLKKFRNLFRIVEKRKPIKIGEFEIEWIHMTHSVIDASSLAISTDAGVILHTGDFKIDYTPVDGIPPDLHRLAYYGEKGVLVLLSDSTNSHKSGTTPSESIVGPTFEQLFKNSEGRVIMSTFSSNIHRVYQAIKYGLQYNRKVAVIGRSMEKNLDVARELGYIDLPNNIFIDANDVMRYPDNEVLIVTTGSQGETMSALYRMATDEHRHISIKHTDTIIISAKAIPGNEASVSAITNFLIKKGAKVVSYEFGEIHVSGHASIEEQKLMLRLVKPKFFLPVHGEYNHIAKHKSTAIQCGVNEKNIYLMEDGDQIEVSNAYMRKVRAIKNGKTAIDNQLDKKIDIHTINERQNLAQTGALNVIINISSTTKRPISTPIVDQVGLMDFREFKYTQKDLQNAIALYLETWTEKPLDTKKMEVDLKNILRKFMFKKTKKYPVVQIYISIV